jgi:hypothetical protein
MRTRAFCGGLIAVASLLCACPPPAPPQPPGPDASDAAPGPPPQDCSAACAALAAAGCSLGAAADCPAFMARDIGSGKVPEPATHRPLTCAAIAFVKTKADAQRLGFACQ